MIWLKVSFEGEDWKGDLHLKAKIALFVFKEKFQQDKTFFKFCPHLIL